MPNSPDEVIAGPSFFAALDQSGGSTPGALERYGFSKEETKETSKNADRIHEQRSRIITNLAFQDHRVGGVILFDETMRRGIQGKPTGQYLKDIGKVPFLKIDVGMQGTATDPGQLMKPIPNLDAVLDDAKVHGMYGTKMRSVIRSPEQALIRNIVDQQFAFAKDILKKDMTPMVEPEVDIHSNDRDIIEQVLLEQLGHHLDRLEGTQKVILKLTLPQRRGLYDVLAQHPKVLRVAALSGGFERDKANAELAQNNGMTASFSRAFLEGLSVKDSSEEFTRKLDASIESIHWASTVKKTA